MLHLYPLTCSLITIAFSNATDLIQTQFPYCILFLFLIFYFSAISDWTFTLTYPKRREFHENTTDLAKETRRAAKQFHASSEQDHAIGEVVSQP